MELDAHTRVVVAMNVGPCKLMTRWPEQLKPRISQKRLPFISTRMQCIGARGQSAWRSGRRETRNIKKGHYIIYNC